MKKGDARIAILYLNEDDFYEIEIITFFLDSENSTYTKDDNNTKKMSHKHTSGLLRSLFEYLLLNNVMYEMSA